MKTRAIVHTPEARRELAAAAAWHDEHGSLGGHQFVAALDQEIERIRDMPFAAPPCRYAPKYRARTLRQLGYRVIYEVTEHEIRIVALAHMRRDPEHWLGRLK